MFRLFKSLAKPQSTPLQILSKFAAHQFIKNIPHHSHSIKTLSFLPSASFFGFFSAKTPECRYMKDLDLIQHHSNEELASYQQILKKYIASKDFADFTDQDSSYLLRALDQLGKVCFEAPIRQDDALKYYEEAMTFVKKRGINDSKEVAALHNGLAYALYLHQRFDEALKNFERAQEMLVKVGLDSESVYPFLQNIYFQGVINFSKGNIEKAEEYLRGALEGSETIPEKDIIGPFLIDIYENLVYVYLKKNDFTQAHEFAQKALDSISKVFGQDHSRGVPLCQDLAYSLLRQGKFDEALIYANKLSNALKRSPEENKNKVIQSLALIAEISTKKNDFANASAHFKQALDILEKSPNSFQNADELYFLAAKSSLAEGKVQEANEIFNKVLSMGRKKFGESGAQVANGLNSWAQTLETNENAKKDAFETYQKSLEIYKKLGGKHVIDVLHNTTRLSDLARQLGNYEESVEYGQKALKVCTESGEGLHWLEQIHSLLATSLFVGGKEAEGLRHFEEAVRFCKESGDKSGDLHSHYFLLADAYFRTKDLERAEETAKEALQLCAVKFGKGNLDTQACLSLVLKVLDAQKKTDESTKLRQAFGQK